VRPHMSFEWDERKNAANVKKHGISFDQAKTVFGDVLAVTVPDVAHSHSESRFVTLGQTATGRLVVVVHTDRGNKTRIISARPASKRERHDYES
jgi:uncharacterized DUF497 family protein